MKRGDSYEQKDKFFVYGFGWFLDKLDSIKYKYKMQKNMNMVKNFGGMISSGCSLAFPENISIGRNSYINGGDILASKNATITIGENCLISYNVHMRKDMHLYHDLNTSINNQGYIEKSIVIEDDIWIGYGAQIMAGVTVAKGSVIAAGAVVTKNTEPYGLYAGVPARRIKERV